MARKGKSNSAVDVPKPTATPSDTSPTQSESTRMEKSTTPQSNKRKRRTLDWATLDFKGFQLKPVKPTKRRKSASSRTVEPSSCIVEQDPFDAGLRATRHQVVPTSIWEGVKAYRKFTIEDDEFEIGDIVFVKAAADQTAVSDAPIEDWVAKVLEVRAADSSHVYLRVYWLYRPEDLPDGRQPYHGRNELVASNDMDLIEAPSVNGAADVIQWKESMDNSEVLDPDQLFWRQTLDVTKTTSQLSQLTRHCIDDVPHNPDNLLVQCDSCNKWLHAACLEKAAVRKACEENDIDYFDDTEPSKKKRKGKKRKNMGAVPFVAKLSYGQTGDASRGILTITDWRSGPGHIRKWSVGIRCLICNAIIEDPTNTNEAGQETGPSGANSSTAKSSIAVQPNRAWSTTSSNHSPEAIDDKSDNIDGSTDSTAGEDASLPPTPDLAIGRSLFGGVG